MLQNVLVFISKRGTKVGRPVIQLFATTRTGVNWCSPFCKEVIFLLLHLAFQVSIKQFHALMQIVSIHSCFSLEYKDTRARERCNTPMWRPVKQHRKTIRTDENRVGDFCKEVTYIFYFPLRGTTITLKLFFFGIHCNRDSVGGSIMENLFLLILMN
jgi:hypothetical protein